ncbi:hypothetical protein MTO96_046300 [Rhipicephalus appendiculatus]
MLGCLNGRCPPFGLDRDLERDGVRLLGPGDWEVRPLGVVQDPDLNPDPRVALVRNLDRPRSVGSVVGW